MKKTIFSTFTIIFLTVSGLLLTQGFAEEEAAKSSQSEVVTADQLKWTDASGLLPKGAEITVVEGELTDEELSVARLRLPADYAVPAHTHPSIERVTVMSGVVNFGTGKELDKEKTTRLEAGSHFRVDAEEPHYVWTGQEEGTVLQIVTDGIFDIKYVNPQDDPRRALGGGPEESKEKPNKAE